MALSIKREKNILVSFSIIVLVISFLFIAFNNDFFSITGFVIGTNPSTDYGLYILNSVEGDDITFVVPIVASDAYVSKAYAIIDVIDASGGVIASLNTDFVSLSPNEKANLKVKWKDSSNSGEYQVRILVLMDVESYSYSKNFMIEKKTLSFESIIINDKVLSEEANIILGENIDFGLLVKNNLPDNVYNVSAGILIYDDLENILSELRSEKRDINASSLERFNVSWDTKGVVEGEYHAKLVINYGDEFIEKDIILNVFENNLEVLGIGYSVSSSEALKPKQNLLLISIVFILVIINLVWWIYYNKRKNNFKKKR